MALVLPEQIGLATAEDPAPHVARNVWTAGAAPTVSDDETQGFQAGSFWYNVVAPYRFYVCVDPTATAAIWKEIETEMIKKSVSVTASEDIASGDAVHLFNDAGTLKARNADASDNTRPCNAFSFASISTGFVGVVIVSSHGTRSTFSGLTIGAVYYLSTTAGAITSTAPSASGNIVQRLGVAMSATVLAWNLGEYFELV